MSFNSLIVEISNNSFTENLRGESASILGCERTLFFLIRDNTFSRNGDTAVMGLTSELAEFVERYTGFKGVTSLSDAFRIENRKTSFAVV